jgi:transposase
VASTAVFTYLFVHPSRGKKALRNEQGIFSQCVGWTIYDCWASYFSLGQGRHGLCGAHLIRELQALADWGRSWATALQKHLLTLYDQSRTGPLSGAARQQTQAEYDRLVAQGYEQEYHLVHLVFLDLAGKPTGLSWRSFGYSLVKRFDDRQAEVLAFTFEAGVPFSNN